MDDRNLILLMLLLTCIPSSLSQSPRKNNLLRIIHQWTFANFDYNSTQDRMNAEQLGNLVSGNVAILDGDFFIDPRTKKMRVFVSTPQFLPGIPATFSEVRDQKLEEPVMSPFPSWDAQNIAACRGPVSVYRFFIDKCGLLWVLDSGKVETFIVPRRACNPKVLIYDLNDNDKLISRYDFPEGVITENSILINLITESYRNDCRDSIAYIADVQARGLVMFDWPKRTSWRVENSYFHPFPDHGTVYMKDATFDLMDGLFGIALSPATDRERKLYFHSAASIRESWVLTSALKNASIVSNVNMLRGAFHHSGDIHEGQSTVEVMTDDGILIYPLLNRNALACWNTAQPLSKEFQHIIYQDDDNLQFVSGLKLQNKRLMITSCKLQNYLQFQANGTDIKYRVMMIDNVDQLLDGSPCKKSQMKSSLPGGSTQRYQTTTYKPTTSHEIGNKFFPQKPSVNEANKEPAISFGPPRGYYNQPPRHPGQDSPQKQSTYQQTTPKTSPANGYHNRETFGEFKYQSTSKSSNQHRPQEENLQRNPTSKEFSADSKESVKKGKSSSESFENESRSTPSDFHKQAMIRATHKTPSYGQTQFNNLDFNV